MRIKFPWRRAPRVVVPAKAAASIQPALPDAPKPGSVAPQTARSEAEERHRRISEAAYHRAERRGFAPGQDQDDWFTAEQDIERKSGGEKKPGGGSAGEQ